MLSARIEPLDYKRKESKAKLSLSDVSGGFSDTGNEDSDRFG